MKRFEGLSSAIRTCKDVPEAEWPGGSIDVSNGAMHAIVGCDAMAKSCQYMLYHGNAILYPGAPCQCHGVQCHGVPWQRQAQNRSCHALVIECRLRHLARMGKIKSLHLCLVLKARPFSFSKRKLQIHGCMPHLTCILVGARVKSVQHS